MKISPQFDVAQPFTEGLAAVEVLPNKKSTQGKWGYIDQTGKLQIPTEFDNALPFSQGIASVFYGEEDTHHLRGWACIDKAGQNVKCPTPPAPAQKTVE